MTRRHTMFIAFLLLASAPFLPAENSLEDRIASVKKAVAEFDAYWAQWGREMADSFMLDDEL